MTETGFDLISQMKESVRYSASLHVAMYYVYYAVPIGGVLMSLRYIQKLIFVDIPKLREGGRLIMDVLILFGSLLLLIFIGMPIGIAVGLSCILSILYSGNLPMVLLAQNCFSGINSFPLMAVPCFIIAGILMGTGGIAKRLLDCAAAFVGFITGGLAIVSTLTSMFFGAISGSSVATVSAIGSFMIPEMKKNGYDEGYSSAVVAAAGTMGVIIPPSVPLVIYGVCTGTSIGDLFKAGLLPGILMGIGLSFACYITSRKKGYRGTGKRMSLKNCLKAIWSAKLAILSPVIILGGIYAGIFTPTEASIISVVYALIIGTFVYKELTLKDIYDSLVEASILSGVTMFLIGFSTTFANYLNLQQIPQMVASFLVSLTSSKILILLIINIFLLLVGMLIDNIPAVLILSPIFLPVVTGLGMSPIQFGVVMTLNLAIGFISPPYGINLFVASAISRSPIEKIVRNLLPFAAALLLVLALVTYVPFFSMALVK